MRPSLQILVALMLKLVLPALVELDHHVPDIIWHTLVTHIVNHLLLKLVRKNCKWLGLRWRRNLLKKVVSECVLETRVFKEDCLWPDVKHSVVTLD